MDIPTDSVSTLKDIAEYTGNIQANLEAAARFGSEYMSYLKAFPEIQRQAADMQREMLQLIRDSASAMDQLRTSAIGYGMNASNMFNGPSTQYFGQFGLNQADRYQDVRSAPQMQQQQQQASADQQAQERDSQVFNYIQSFGGIPGSNIYPVGPGMSYATFTMSGTGVQEPFRLGAANASAAQAAEQRREDEKERQKEVRRRQQAVVGSRGGKHRADEEDDEDEQDSVVPPAHNLDNFINSSDHNVNSANAMFQQLMGSVGSGATPVAGRLSLLGNLMKGLGSIPGFKALAGAGVGVGAGAMLFNMVQNAGEQVSEFRNMDIHGHTLGGGMGVQKDVMLMSLNPLISSDQARQIIMGALNSGYSGKSYDNAVDFIKDNLVNMNMDVAKSVDLLRSNVDLGKQSIEGLKLDLNTMKGSAAAQNGSIDTAISDYTAMNDFILQHGGNATRASTASTYLGNMFKDKDANGNLNALGKTAKGSSLSTGVQALLGLADNSNFAGLMGMRHMPGVRSDMVVTKMINDKDNPTELMDSLLETVQYVAMKWQSAFPADPESARQGFYDELTSGYGFTDSMEVSNELYDQVLSKGWKGISNKAVRGTTQGKKVSVNNKPITKNTPTYEEWKKQPGNSKKTEHQYEMDVFGGDKYVPDMDINSFIQQLQVAGTRAGNKNANWAVVEKDGKAHILNLQDKQQLIGLERGDLKLVQTDTMMGAITKGSFADATNPEMLDNANPPLDSSHFLTKPMTMAQLLGTSKSYAQTAEPGPAAKASGGSKITYSAPGVTSNSKTETTIGLTPEAQRWLQINAPNPGSVPNDINSVNANSGYNGAQRNDAAPGNK